jgi:hypothetical protein
MSPSSSKNFSWNKWDETRFFWGSKEGNTVTLKLYKILAPLLVYRQFHAEAKSKFFNLNQFHCRSPEGLHNLLQKTSKTRRAELTHISFVHDYNHTGAANLFKILASLPRLRKLDMSFNEERWVQEMQSTLRGRRRALDATNMPGFLALRVIHGLEEVSFYQSPVAKHALKASMLKPKSEVAASTRSKK